MFSLNWEDLVITPPGLGETLGLELGNGCIGKKLLDETKTNRTSRADQYISYNLSSGLSLGVCLEDLRDLHCHLFGEASGPIFRHHDGTRWTGSHFLSEYLHPWLQEQKRLGDPTLSGFVDADGLCTIIKRFFSMAMGTYRRGGRSHVQKKRAGCFRRATPAEIYEHGHWEIKKGTETAIIHYNEVSIGDKLDLTLLCM